MAPRTSIWSRNNKGTLIALGGALLWSGCAHAQNAEQPANGKQNIALNAPVTFDKNPNYALCSDPDDIKQLTDGQYAGTSSATAEGFHSLWVQKGTVGWSNANPVVITIDLGKVQPISGIGFNTGGGRAGVVWPSGIFIAVSDDNKEFHYLGDLVDLSRKGGQKQPAPDVDAVFKYETTALKTKGRYVTLAVAQQPYTFVDEIEVYKGDDAWVNQPAGGQIVDGLRELVASSRTRAGMISRVLGDIQGVRSALETSKLSAARKAELSQQLDAAAKELDGLPAPDIATFTTTIPQNDVHARVLAIYGEILGAELPSLVAWQTPRYAWLPLLTKPEAGASAPKVSIEMMGNEHRADSFLLTNATGKATTATLKLQSLPGGAKPAWLTVSGMPWTDTAQNVPVAAALPEAKFANGAYTVSIPAGLTRKIWLEVDSSQLPAGAHTGTIQVAANGKIMNVPISVRVSKVKMGRPRVSLGMWDYSHGDGVYGLTPQNRVAAIKMMQSHLVDTPWATSAALPRPTDKDFDANHQLKAPIKYDLLDAWVKEWPNARNYFVFASVGDTIGSARIGSEEFDKRVGAWAKDVSQHARSIGLKPEQIGILLVDEPHNDEQDAIIAAWAKAINASAPELTLFQDPTWERPDQTKIQDAITQVDIVCPLITFFEKGGQPVADYYQKRRAAGQTLWFYQCQGPARLFSPARYHRLQSWYAWKHGAVGLGFWAFGDTGGAKSSWNEYNSSYNAYTPVFIGENDVTDGIHMEAVREGMEDYEYLAMLRDAAAKSKDAGMKARAEALLAEATNAVTDNWSVDYTWSKDGNTTAADIYRLRILAMLEQMNA